ncbi:hypothetical protein Ccrd_019824 [Cynara cardunculus var. scolymus]|uniref:Uncharacterized protein n=1 Tax=Cynara cardunculus var. scolymus TaxID=59895 RepID=A0A103Y3M3_CYNCS|nr:hypothetical protein Ccrd_019824 [Cynara cardunculus var. scolymus]
MSKGEKNCKGTLTTPNKINFPSSFSNEIGLYTVTPAHSSGAACSGANPSVLLRLRLTRAAAVAAPHQKPNSDDVTGFEFANIRSYLHHFTHHFMPTSTNKIRIYGIPRHTIL